ncbi:hypothetical protein [Planobacterium oryzisoli]|uniref:Peptidoglycan-binding protein LysM n=1 Tax=Planobacterium oryzisoli TaxID=2771435 RepID=A0A930YVQ5_9FLAO|nr:hypothetical protein [Planobacterium oryzisoli]MBF5027198.1 hypothetical protein [Planobacterium oryzisoli]
MKKLTLLAILVTAGLTASAKAQATNQSTAELNILLHPIQTIIVNPGQATVNLEFKTKDAYKNGVESKQVNHLNIYSTGGFEIKASATSDKLTSTASTTSTLPLADILLTASESTADGITGAQYQTNVPIAITASPASGSLLVSHTSGGVNKNIDITYKAAPDDDAYINKYIRSQSPTEYTTTIIYQIAAK